MKLSFRILLLIAVQSMLFVATMSAQSTDRDFIRVGNKHYHKGDFDKALTNYTKALEKKKTVEAYYNFACASLLMGQDSTANANFHNADSLGFTNQLKRAHNYHNLGNIWYTHGIQQMRSNDQKASESFQNAVNLYKSSLRCNPNDNETRYNLAMAQYQLKKNQNGGGGNNNDQNQDKDKDKQDQQKQDQQKQDQQQQQQQQQQEDKNQMSKEAAEQLLNSAQQDEKNVQRKVKANPTRRRSLEKDW